VDVGQRIAFDSYNVGKIAYSQRACALDLAGLRVEADVVVQLVAVPKQSKAAGRGKRGSRYEQECNKRG
jgi:hypothetical protein